MPLIENAQVGSNHLFIKTVCTERAELSTAEIERQADTTPTGGSSYYRNSLKQHQGTRFLNKKFEGYFESRTNNCTEAPLKFALQRLRQNTSENGHEKNPRQPEWNITQ